MKDLVRLGVSDIVTKLAFCLWTLQVQIKILIFMVQHKCAFRPTGVDKACSNLTGEINQLISVPL